MAEDAAAGVGEDVALGSPEHAAVSLAEVREVGSMEACPASSPGLSASFPARPASEFASALVVVDALGPAEGRLLGLGSCVRNVNLAVMCSNRRECFWGGTPCAARGTAMHCVCTASTFVAGTHYQAYVCLTNART